MDRTSAQPHVVIVGGGISGLAAAFSLRDAAVRVTVLEGSPRLGGKLSVSEIAGVAVDEGAEALLVTRPEGTGLIAEAGLGDQRAAPGPTSSAIWTRGALRPLPRRQFMGVPSDMAELARSGVLSGEGVARAVKAVTFSTVKWPHVADATASGAEPLEIVRCSVGRVGEEALLQRADDELAALAAAELAEATGVRGAPTGTRVTRWGGALPQYTVGHLDRVAAIRAAVAAQPGLAVCGAAYDGVGIPACVATAREAVSQVLAFLAARPPAS